jgi:ABC-2 type transport system permease protein
MNLKASVQMRGALLLSVFMMLFSNLIFFSMWGLFFHQFREIKGWHLEEMAFLVAFGSAAYGIKQVFFGGLKGLANLIVKRELDLYLTRPKNTLLQIVASRSQAKGWGQILTAVLILPFLPKESYPLFCFCTFSAFLIFSGGQLLSYSLLFWHPSLEELSQRYNDALFLFALYPSHIYSGAMQLFMFTVIPAGLISFLPVDLFLSFRLEKLLILLVSAGLFFSASVFAFYRGLRRYIQE